MVQTYRANLTAAEFPLLTEFQGRTIITPSIDQNYTRSGNSPKNRDRDFGIPQVYYMHNMIPTDAGLTSVGFNQVALPPLDTDNKFSDIYSLRDATEKVARFSNTTSGRNYVLLSLGSGWIRTTDKAPVPGGYVTTAHVNGQTYICFSNVGVFKYNFATNTLDEVTLKGLDKLIVIGITASSGYMIAWSATTVVWSSVVDPTDFIPSLATGAGGGAIQEAKAAITVCLPANGGFIIYTKVNAVSAVYSGNSRYPFTLKEIIGAGGLSNPSLSAYDGNSTDQLSYTTSGLQRISMNNSEVVLPHITDFIAGAQFEDYDDNTESFTLQNLSVPMVKKLTQVGNRYIVISYGVTQLTHALVLDIALGRWGKIKLTHVDCFEYFYPSSDVVDSPKRNIGFLQADGRIQVAVVSYNSTGSFGIVMLGKYQLDRNRYLEIQAIHIDSVTPGTGLKVKIQTTIDGKNVTFSTVPKLSRSVDTYRRYDTRVSGLNHSIIMSGAMHLNSLELQFNDAGEVR